MECEKSEVDEEKRRDEARAQDSLDMTTGKTLPSLHSPTFPVWSDPVLIIF